ncbi:MAG: hypothetical protein M3Y82_14150 [Verrucomicrobiota bacterium]|nr:hypothetical protein [Verrucomicrobiota bacterium]
MKHTLSAILGIVTSAVGSFIIALGISMTAGYLRHRLESWPWLFSVSAIPCILVALSFSLAVAWTQKSCLHFHFVAILGAFFGVAVAGSAGAIAIESLRRGLNQVNIFGYLTWCWVYATGFLPLSYPLALFLQRIIHRIRDGDAIH